MQSVYDYYWANYSADSTGLSGLGYNEFVRQCDVIGPAMNQHGMDQFDSTETQKPTSRSGRRRRSSFPPASLMNIRKSSNGGVNLSTGSSDEQSTVEEGTDSTNGTVPPTKINVDRGLKTVVAMNPRSVITACCCFRMITRGKCHAEAPRQSLLHDHLQ